MSGTVGGGGSGIGGGKSEFDPASNKWSSEFMFCGLRVHIHSDFRSLKLVQQDCRVYSAWHGFERLIFAGLVG